MSQVDPGPLRLDVYADVACPWCFIGKRNLEAALRDFPAPVEVRHRAYQLRPDLSAVGVAALPLYEKKFGGPERVRAMFDRVTQAGAPAGIRFDWGRLLATNTRLAHRVVALCEEQGHGQAALEALFRGQFEEGCNVGDEGEALALLDRHGVPVDATWLHAQLLAGGGDERVDHDLRQGRELGVDGVPMFVADRRLAVQGAQPPEVLRAFLDEAVRRG